MIPQKYRFHGHGSLRYLYRRGQTIRTRTLTVRYVHNARRTENRYSVIVARKILKKAVQRNRLRRRIYEIIRRRMPAIRPGYDITVTVFSPDLLTAPHDELESQVITALERAKLV